MKNKAKPLARYRTPSYPTRLMVLSEPDLLRKHIPPAWQSTAELAGALTLFMAINSTVNAKDERRTGTPDLAVPAVAPIFEHGTGRGAVGCVVVAPPVFLSEEEALQVITEEMDKAGFKASQSNVDMKHVATIKRREEYRQIGKNYREEIADVPGSSTPFNVDRIDQKKQIAIEFVSHADYFTLGGAMSSSTVQGFNFKEVADSVAKRVKEKGRGVYLGVMYDPLSRPDKTSISEKDPVKMREAFAIAATAESKRLLRLQVKDFIDWLQAQGAL